MLYALFCPGGIRYDPAGKKRDAPGLYRAGAAGSVMAVGQNGQLADLYAMVSTEGMRFIFYALRSEAYIFYQQIFKAPSHNRRLVLYLFSFIFLFI